MSDTPANVLVVDDTLENLRLLEKFLSTEGHLVRVATSGKQALASAAKSVPDLMLLDINMPDMDGLEVCRRFKSDRVLSEVPILFLSAYTDVEYKVKAFEIGGVDYVSKPFMWEEVRARINVQLKLQRARRALQMTSARLQLATRAACIGIWEWDVEQDVMVWDDAMYRLYGMGRADFSHTRAAWERLWHVDDKARVLGDLQAAIQGGREFETEFRVVSPDGVERFLRVATVTFRNPAGQARRMLGVSYDISELKQGQADLRELNAVLEERVAQRAGQLASARLAAEKATQAKGDFFDVVRRQARVPLVNVLRNAEEVLLEADMLTASQKAKLDAVRGSADRLLRLLAAAQEVARGGSGAMPLEKKSFDLKSTLSEEIAQLSFRAVAKGLSLESNVGDLFPIRVDGDAARVRQMLSGVVDCAMDALSHGGMLVQIHSEDAMDARHYGLHIVVHGTGDGANALPPADLSESVDLALAGRLALAMGGRLWSEPRAEGGHMLHVRCVLDVSGLAGASDAPAPVRRQHVLLVGRDRVNLQALTLLLQQRGIEVEEACPGDEARAFIDYQRFDAILLEVDVPERDGAEMVQHVRAGASARRWPMPRILALGGARADRASCLAVGMDGWLSKPVATEALLTALAGATTGG